MTHRFGCRWLIGENLTRYLLKLKDLGKTFSDYVNNFSDAQLWGLWLAALALFLWIVFK